MPSPFPGMNPYLEQEDVWHDFHETFQPYVREALTARLASHYIVKIDEHIMLPAIDVERLSYLEIRDRRDRRVVTVIELLSPANEYAGPDREQYLGKRGELLSSAVHQVEIDLLRGGPLVPIPLRDPDPDASLDLQAVLHHIYDAARYVNYIYEGSPQPPLRPDDEAWVRGFVAAEG